MHKMSGHIFIAGVQKRVDKAWWTVPLMTMWQEGKGAGRWGLYFPQLGQFC